MFHLQVLTLPSNERILLTPPMRLLFEISHLKHATPATVSRAGVLNVGPKDVGWMPFTSSWTDALEHRRVRSIFSVLFSHYPPAVLEYASKLTLVVHISEIGMMEACCHLLDALLLHFSARLKGGTADKITYERIFIFALMWGVCGLIPSEHHGRVRFSVWWRQTFKQVEIPEAGIKPFSKLYAMQLLHFCHLTGCTLQIQSSITVSTTKPLVLCHGKKQSLLIHILM